MRAGSPNAYVGDVNLTELPPRTRAVVTGIDLAAAAARGAGSDLALRYRELGLRAGAAIEVTHVAAFGGRVIALGADRFALDRTTCRRIQVEVRAGVPA